MPSPSELSGRRVLVTGGAGFIGSNLARRLLELGADPVVFDNFATGKRENLDGVDVEVIEGDLRNYEQVLEAASGCDLISHQGALGSVPRSVKNPLETNAVNVEGTLHVLEAARARGVSRVVFASSSSVYGDSTELPKSEAHTTIPVSPYGVSKLAAEKYCTTYHAVYGMETICLRYFNVFGPRQDPSGHYAAVIPKFIHAALAGSALTIFGDGDQSRDFTHVENVLSANVAALTCKDAPGQVLNIAAGAQITVNELATAVGEALGSDVEIVHVSERPGDIRHSYAATGAAKAILDYTVEVGWKQGLEQTVEWYRRTK